MLGLNSSPAGFRFLSERPDLQIKYRSQLNGCLILFLLPFIYMFLLFVGALISLIYEILHLSLWKVFQQLPNTIGNYWWFPFCFFLFSAPTFFALWHIFGITCFQASHESLIIIKQLFVIHLKINIPSTAIRYFSQIKDGGEGEDSFPSWGLEVILNHGIYERNISLTSWLPELSDRRICKTVMLLDRQSIDKSNWLGKVLADFYEVDYRNLTTPVHQTEGSLGKVAKVTDSR
jgi:hypothetical protein